MTNFAILTKFIHVMFKKSVATIGAWDHSLGHLTVGAFSLVADSSFVSADMALLPVLW